jgi:hypothetical protein
MSRFVRHRKGGRILTFFQLPPLAASLWLLPLDGVLIIIRVYVKALHAVPPEPQ